MTQDRPIEFASSALGGNNNNNNGAAVFSICRGNGAVGWEDQRQAVGFCDWTDRAGLSPIDERLEDLYTEVKQFGLHAANSTDSRTNSYVLKRKITIN